MEADPIIHLAGASVADEAWTAQRKTETRNSGILSTRLIRQHLMQLGLKPLSIVCASAVGFYGCRGEDHLSEEAIPGTGFLEDVYKEWEVETEHLGSELRVNTSTLRVGIVLRTLGGALPQLALSVKWDIEVYRNGGQLYSWIQVEDLFHDHSFNAKWLRGAV